MGTPQPAEHADDSVARAARVLREALKDMPVPQQEQVLGRLISAAEGDNEQFGAFVKGLLLAARLHRNPAYSKALAAADENLERDMANAISLEEFIARRSD